MKRVVAGTTGTVVPSVAAPGSHSLSHDGEGLISQWLSRQVQRLDEGTRVWVTLEVDEEPT